ncbi:hypothetical protein [Hoeflea halophila]|nr:hypothetical protein [Hoeflea halophila]
MDSFDAVLDRVTSERAEARSHGSGAWAAMRGWNSSFVATGLGAQPWPAGDQRVAAPSVIASEEPSPAPGPSTPAPRPEPAIDTSHFQRLSAKEVAEDIDLQASDSAAVLKSKRRRFARINHPDRAPLEWRQAATTRMKIANQMVDEALRRV